MKKITIKRTQGTSRIEAFSDSIFAFCITLLALDIKIPELNVNMNSMEMAGNLLVQQLPHFITYILSFLIIAILWVNHHHFFENFKYTDWKLLWYNNFLLFWVILIPFSTNFIGEHPGVALADVEYSGVMFLVALSFFLMVRYVFFKSHLLDIEISEKHRREEFQHTFPAVILYGLATVAAFWRYEVSLAILVLVPALYFIPSFLHLEKSMVEELPEN